MAGYYHEYKRDSCFGTLFSPLSAFSLTGIINVYTPSQGTNKEKCFGDYNIKAAMPILA